MGIESIFSNVPEDWEFTTLGEVCTRGKGVIQTGPFGSQLHASDYVPVGIPTIMPKNIGDNRVIEDGISRITEKDAQRLDKYRVRFGDIVYSRRGDVRKRALIRSEQNGWLCGTGSLMVRFGAAPVDPIYASYYLGHPRIQDWIEQHAVGATMPNLNTSIMASVPFVLPPLSKQNAIAEILGSLDDKIDLSRKMNQTLESLTRALFKSWFVDFDPVWAKMEGRQPVGMDTKTSSLFPTDLIESQIGKIPPNWNVESIYDCANFINGAAYRDFDFSFDNSGLPIIKIAEIKNGITNQTKFTNKQIDEKFKIKEKDILFSWSGSPDTSIDTFIWSGSEAWLNQHIFKVIPKKQNEKWFTYLLLRHFKSIFIEIARNKQTTGLGHVTRKDLQRLFFAFPPEIIMNNFLRIIDPFMECVFATDKESQTLAALRDTLLPRLMSGDVRVKDLEG